VNAYRRSVFIVRPFGKQEEIDFTDVHEKLIRPALDELGLQGSTTEIIAEAGNIREDMFRLLATADLVIADLSIHNANVFYELGVRHALREKRTILIRAAIDKVPFDLLTDRYLQYAPSNPAATVPKLIAAIEAMFDSDNADSPVFKLLRLDQELLPADLARLTEAPDDFREEVRRAENERRSGDLALLAEEATRLVWARQGLRRVGGALFELGAHETAARVWEQVRAYAPRDIEANGRLATCYQKLKQPAKSSEAVVRVLEDNSIIGPQRAEMLSLRASNTKTRWIEEWSAKDNEAGRRLAALKSRLLSDAYGDYSSAFESDRNHFYSGLNALAMANVVLALAEALPKVWGAAHPSDAEAADALGKLKAQAVQVRAAVQLAIEGKRRQLEFRGERDEWLDISAADLAFLSPELTPERVANRYGKALELASFFAINAARRQMDMFRKLGIFVERAEAALVEMDTAMKNAAPPAAVAEGAARVLLFTGHRVDPPGRKEPRFPAAAVDVARKLIRDAVGKEAKATGGLVVGLAGCASGGDILFHEACADEGLPSELFLLGSRDAYVATSVQDGGPEWVGRFDALMSTHPWRVLGNSEEPMRLPRWLRPAKDYSVWERSNRWILHNALVYGASKVTLIALWNRAPGDGPGGTKHMVESAQEGGAKVEILDATVLLKTPG
jgi:hypothetical protein